MNAEYLCGDQRVCAAAEENRLTSRPTNEAMESGSLAATWLQMKSNTHNKLLDYMDTLLFTLHLRSASYLQLAAAAGVSLHRRLN